METTIIHLLAFAILNLAILLFGFGLIKNNLIFLSWVLLVTSLFVMCFIFINEHPIIKMLAIIATTFNAMKVIAVAKAYEGKPLTLSFKQWLVFAGGWAGMRAQPFETLGKAPLPNAWPLVKFGTSRIIAGLVFIFIARQVTSIQLSLTIQYILVSALLLVGLSLILHFGLLSISAGMWRLHGINTYPLFNHPAKAISLTEFWSKRWNIAFSEMTSVAIFRPLQKTIGSPAALMLAFVFSGLLHELALSVPVNNGYGLPTLYFILQGLLVLIEKALSRNNILFLQNKVIGKIWVFFWLVMPMPLLFHQQFIKQVVWPIAGLVCKF